MKRMKDMKNQKEAVPAFFIVLIFFMFSCRIRQSIPFSS